MATYSIGFTGTQQGMTPEQKEAVSFLIEHFTFVISEVHHGDCVGSDAQFHDIAKAHHYYVVLHPPVKEDKRAFCNADEYFPKKDYLVRNRDIVDNSDVLIATPKSKDEEVRSGTWSTVRYARKMKKKVIIVFPDGKTKTRWT
jgi:hypothetical protein